MEMMLLNYLNVDFEYVFVDIFGGGTRTDEFLKVKI